MRAKYLIMFAGIGAAFIGISLWVFLSKGRNARAIRAKYKLGGALLTIWAMFSAATCGPRIRGVVEPLCYDMPMPVNEVSFGVKENGSFADGDVLKININNAVCSKYSWKITDKDREKVLQKGEFLQLEDTYRDLETEITVKTGGYSGKALFILDALYPDGDDAFRSEELTAYEILIKN